MWRYFCFCYFLFHEVNSWIGCEDKSWRCNQFPLDFCDLDDGDYMKEKCPNRCDACVLPRVCGKSMVSRGRVIGGENAQVGAWPWQVGIYHKNNFFCSGTLANEQWVITAAHCVEKKSRLDLRIVIGDNDRRRSEKEQIFQPSLLITHPKYMQPYSVSNDIALVKLNGPVLFTKRIQPICLPKQGEEPGAGSKCYITGWGKTKWSGVTHPILQQLPLMVRPNHVCNKMNAKYFPVSNSMLCAANNKTSGNKSGCHGDSGGPFVCFSEDGTWKLHGVVSWGSPKCNSNDAYSVFVKVNAYRSWIDKYIRLL